MLPLLDLAQRQQQAGHVRACHEQKQRDARHHDFQAVGKLRALRRYSVGGRLQPKTRMDDTVRPGNALRRRKHLILQVLISSVQ